MWRPLSVLVALGALLGPVAATAAPPAPEPAAPALVGTPYLVRTGAQRVSLYVRLDRPLARRFDGELLATATIDGRFSSLAAVRGRAGRRTACYTASVSLPRAELGRLSTVGLLVDGGEPLTTLLALRAERPGDARGAPLRC
jgi:hypothetical protein